MILYVNGDSNCYGTELSTPDKSWPKLLSATCSATLINQALPGASNSRIIRLTREFLKKNKDVKNLFVIIATTTWEREEWLQNEIYYNISAGTSLTSLPEHMHARFKDWVVNQTDTVRAYKSQYAHQQFYDLHLELKMQSIGHLFFHGINPFMNGANYETFDKFDWEDYFIEPYNQNSCYYWYLKNQGFEPTSGYHHNEQAQHHWADFIHRYLKEKKLL